MENDPGSGMGTSNREYLVRLWSEQLNRPLDVRDDFFEAGGSSMQVIEMLTTVLPPGARVPVEVDSVTQPSCWTASQVMGAVPGLETVISKLAGATLDYRSGSQSPTGGQERRSVRSCRFCRLRCGSSVLDT